MREGMVLEVYKDHVVVLAKGGEYLKLRKKGEVNIGDIYRGKPYFKLPTYYVAAAIMLIVISTYTGVTAYANQIVGYVDINGDKTVRLYVNRKGTVQRADGIENPKSLKNLSIEKAAGEISKISEREKIFEDASKVQISTKEIKSSGINFDKEKNKLEKVLLKKENLQDQKSKDPKAGNTKENSSDKNDKKVKETKDKGNSVNKASEPNKVFEKIENNGTSDKSEKNKGNKKSK